MGAENGALLYELKVAAVGGEAFHFAEVGAGIHADALGVLGDDAAAQSGAGFAKDGDLAADAAQGGTHDVLGVFHDTEAAEQQRDGDGDWAFVGDEVVVEAVLAGDEGRGVGDGGLGHALGAFHEGAELALVVGIAHAEIVEDGDAVRIGPHGDELAHALIDDGAAHEMRVGLAPLGQQGAGEGDELLAAIHTDDAAVLRGIA